MPLPENEQKKLLYQFAHVGFNCTDENMVSEVAQDFIKAFDMPFRDIGGAIYVGTNIEIMRKNGQGQHGHICIQTNDISLAIEDLRKKNFSVNMETAVYREERLFAVYLTHEFGGFAVHLLERN